MIPGSKGRKFDARSLAREFLNLGPAKIFVKSHFSKKNERFTNILRIVRARCAKQSGIKEVKIPFDLYIIKIYLRGKKWKDRLLAGMKEVKLNIYVQ